MATENEIAEAVKMESEEEKRGITSELLDPMPNKFSSEEPKKSPSMQVLPAEITELLMNAEDVQSSCNFPESTHADRKDIDRASEGEKLLESSSEAAIVKAEDENQLQRAGTLETDERTTDEGKHFQEEKSDQDYNTDDVTSAVSRVAKTVEANFNVIEEQRTEEVLDKNVDSGCGTKVDRTDNVANVDTTFASQDVGENIFDVESKVSEKSLDLPAEQNAPQSPDICKQTEDEKVEIDQIIQNGTRDASIAAVAVSSDTPNEDTEFTTTSDEGEKKPDESSIIVAANMSMKHEHEVDTVELKETTSTESQDITELSAEMKHVMPAGESEEYKTNSTGSAVIIEPVANSPHQIDEEVARHMDVEEANDLTQETVIQVVQNTLAEDEDGTDREENLDGSSAKHVESMQRDYSNPFSTEASEGKRHDSGHLTGEVVMDVRGQGLTDAKDHIAKEISPVNAESEGSFLQQSLQGNEQPELNTEVLHEAVSCIKEEARSKSCEGRSTQKVDEDKSMDNWPKDEVVQENSPLNPEGDQQRSEAVEQEIECEKDTGEREACNPKETKTEDGSEACKSTELQDAGHPSREGHDPEDVATDIAASGDIHCTESVADEILQPSSEPEIVLETAPTCRAEHESCCGEKEKAAEAGEYKGLKAKSCNTTNLTDETIRTGPAEYSDTTQKENECEIKSSEEPEPAGADRSMENDTPQGNESSKMSLQISLPMHGEMTQEVEGKEKGTTVVNLADNSSITGLDMVIQEASTPEKDSEEAVNKNERAAEFERSLDDIPEPTEADSTNRPKMGGTILCHEELSAKGTDEDNVKYDQNEINKSYEQTGRSSTTEGLEDLILLNANKETGESTGQHMIEEDPIQERTTEAIAHRRDNVMGCLVNPSTEEAVDYTKNITKETNAARDFEVLAEGISEGRPSKDDREEENHEEVHTQLVTFTSCKKTDVREREEDAKSKISPAVDEQEIENQKSKSMSDAISLKEEGKYAKVFTEQVEAAHSVDNAANTENDNMETCSKIQSTSIDECSEKEMPPTEHVEYYQSESPCAPPETNSEVNGAAERLEVPSANGSQVARVSAIEDGVPTNDNESEAKNNAGSTDTTSGVDECPTSSAKQERRLENTDNNVKEDDLTDSGQKKGEIPATVDAIKESTECEILDKETKDSEDLGTTEKPAVDTLQGSLCSILKTEAGEEECEASVEYEGPDKNGDHLYGTHSTEGVLMPQEYESTKIVSESEEVETAKGSAQKEVSEDLHGPPEVPFAALNIAEGTCISATNATEETEKQIPVDQHNSISDERSENTHLEMKEIGGETHDEDFKHQESFAPETDIKGRTPEEKVSTENDEDNLKEDYVPDKAAFHPEVRTPIGEEMGAADTISTQNLKTMELTEQTQTRNMEIEENSRLGRETGIAGQVEEEVHDQHIEVPIGLVIPPMETIKEDTIKEPESGINRDIAAVEIGQEEVRPQKERLDDRPNMASGICSDMGPPERTETDHSKHGEEVDGTKCYEISINLLPNSSQSDSKSAEREIPIVENPTITEEEIELPSDKKDETRASDVKESTEMEKCSSIENTDAEEPEKHEEISERLATSATQNGEAAEDGSASNQTIPRESTLELLTPASVSLLEEKENGPKTADEKITDGNEEEVEMQLNESLTLSSGTVQTDEACIDKKEPKKNGVSRIDSNNSESEKDTPNGQKEGCIHGEEVLKVEAQEKESKTANPDSPEVGDTTAEVSVTTEEGSSIVSSKSENVHEVVPDVQTNESFIRLEDVDLKDMKVEATIDDVEPEQKCQDAIEANDMSQNVITDEVVLQGQLKTEETQNGEELETGKGDKKLSLESCKIGEMRDFVPVLEDTQAIDQAEHGQAGNADNKEIQISKIENDDEGVSTSKTADATKDIVKEVVKETATLDDFNAPTKVAVETAEIGIPPKEASSGVFNKNVHEVMSDVQEYGSSIELEHDEMKGMKVEAVTSDVKPEEKCEDAIGANDMSQNGITNEGLPDENKRLEETQDGEQRENGEGDIKINEKKDYICPIPAEDIEEVVQDEQAQAGNAGKEQIHDKLKDSISVSKTEDSMKDFDEIIKKTDTLDELNATTIAAVETAAEISILREEASGDVIQKGKHMHEVMSDVQTNESSGGPEDAEMNAMKVEAVTADVEPAEKCEDGIEEIDMSQNAITNEGMTDAHMTAPLLESCTISEKKDFSKALAEVTEATDQFELEKAGHADNEEIQTSESMIRDRLKDCVSVSKIEDATRDVEKENITEAGTTDESNATTLIAVPETTEIEIPTEEASAFVLSERENTHEVVLDVQANESSMGSEDAEMKGTQVEEVMADVKPEEKREDASEANDMSQNAITSEEVPDSHTKEGGEENRTGEGDNPSLLGRCKINEKKDFGPVVAEDTEATDQVEEAESENADNEEIQTSKNKTDDKPEDSVLVCKTADATKDIGKKITQEVDTTDELNATTIAAAETEITMREPQAEETPAGTSTVPPDSVTVQNSNSDDFERIGMVSKLSPDNNFAHDETIDGAEKTSTNEKLGLAENEAEPDGTAHQATVSKTDQGKTAFSEETIADQALSAKKLESLVQTPVFVSLPGGGEENIEKVENIEGHDKVAGEMELKENLELSFPEERTDTECLERPEPRNPRVTETEISASESTQDTNEDEKEQNTHGEALKAAPEEKEKETEFAVSPLCSIKDKELSGPYEKASDVMLERSKTAQVDMSEVQTVETSEESDGGENQDENLEAVAISKPAERNVDAIVAENVEQEMQNEQEKADGSKEINEQETMKDVDSKDTHGTTPGNSIINQVMHTGSVSEGEITHCDEQTNAEKLALEEDDILNGGGIYIAQTKDALEDFHVTKEIKEEAGSCSDKTDTAALTSLRTETSTLAILQDDIPLEASPTDLEGPSREATEPGLILSSKNIDKETLDETSSTTVCQLSDREKENATTQNPHVSESRTKEVGENDSSFFLVEKRGEAATTDENIGEKSLDGEMAQINENIILTDVTEVCCKKEDSIKHADSEFEIQANQVTKDTSCEEDKEGSNQVENMKLELPEEESKRRSESSTSADQRNMGTLAKAAADDLEPEKHCDIATDTLKDEILREEVFNGPVEADEHENLMKEHQVEENRNPNETVAMSPGNRAICEMTDAHMKAPLLESCTISENKDFGKALAEVTGATDQFELEKAGQAEKGEIQTSESTTRDRLKDCVSVTKIEDATKDIEKENITEAGTADESNATTLISLPETTEIKIPTEEASGFVLSESENTHEVVLDVQANESSMGSKDAEMKGTQVEEVMADVKPEEKHEDASEENDMSQNAITSEGVLDSCTKEAGEENRTGEGDNSSLLGSCKINEKKDFGPVVAEDTEATDQVEEAESEKTDNEEIQTSKSMTDDKPEDSVLVCKTADATKDVGKKITQEVDTPDEFNATTIAAAETEIAVQEPHTEETPVGTSTVPPDSATFQNSNADDFERIGMFSELSHDSNSARHKTIDGAEKKSTNEKLGLVENESEPDGTAHQVTVSETDQGKTVFNEETIPDQALSAKKLESLVQTPVFASLPGGEENIEKGKNIEGHDEVAGEMELKENLELSFPEERTDTECLERPEPRNPGVTELEISANESTQDTSEDEKEQNTHGEALKAAPEEKEKETEFADSPLCSIKTRELSGSYEKASDVRFKTSKTAQADMSEVQTVETSEESDGGEIQDGNLEAVAISKPAERKEDAIIAENVEQEMQNEQEKADGSKEINEQETMKAVDSKGTHGTTPGSSMINQDMLTGSASGETTHCDEQTNAEKLALEEDNILYEGGIYIAQTKDALEDFHVTKEIKEEAGSCSDKTDTAAMTSLRTETSTLAILQDDKPLEASPADLEGPSREATEPGLILSSKNIDKENLDETSSASVCQLSDSEKENATTQNPHVSDSRTNEAGEDDSSFFLVEKGGEAATTDENIGEKRVDGGMTQINENIILTDVTEVCCEKEDSIKNADTEFEIQANQVTVDTSCEVDKEDSNQVENVKLELPEEESERRSESSASADQGNMGTLAKAAADDLEPEKHCDIATEAADTLKDEILHEEVFNGPIEADEHENLMKEHQVEENRNPNETVAMSPGNRAICEMTDAHMKAPLLESCTISENKDFGKALAEVTEATDQFELEKAGHAEKGEIQTSESTTRDRLKDCVSVTKIEDATKDVEKENITEAGTADESNATTLISLPETTEIKIPTEEASGFVLSESENTHEVVLDVQANESSMGSENAETKGTQVEEVMADVKPEEKREDASEANDMSQNAITSEGVLDSHKKEGGEENETGEGDNSSLPGSCKINEKKDFGPVVAEDTEATDQVEEAESENADNEKIQTSKSKTDDKPEDSVLVCKTADATKDFGKKIIQEVDAPDEFNATTTAAAETEVALLEPQAEETPVGTSTVPPDSETVQNSNADDFERIGMVSELSRDSNSAHDETIDGAEKTSTNEKLGLVENEAEPDGTAHQVTVSETDQGKTVFSEETIADQALSAKKLESLVQTPVFVSLPGGGEENIEKVENIEGHDKVAGEMELKENLELSFPEERTDTECLERPEPRNPRVTETEISANESTQDTNEDEKEQNTHGEALKAAPEEKEKETEFAVSPLCSIKDKELSGPYEKASDVMLERSKTAQVDMSEVQTVETSEESGSGEIQNVNLEAVAISKPAERNEDAIIVENVKQEMQNEQEKADGSEEINEQETMKDVDSKETHGTTPGNSIINQVMHTGSVSEGEITHCDEQTNAEKLASRSESYATVALEEDNILNGGGIYIAQTKDALEDFHVTKEIKEEAGSCSDKTDTAAMTSLRTETSTLAILQDYKPLEASPADLEGPSREVTEPGLILSSKNIDKENLDETSSASVCQLSDSEKENATTQNPRVSDSRTNEAGEDDSSFFLVEKGGEAATTDENIGEKRVDGGMAQINENIIWTDVTEVCCEKDDTIKNADTEFEIQANQVTVDTSCEVDKEDSNQVENVKLELPEEESERRSESSASADQGNMGTLAKAAADDLEPEKHCDIATEAADTLKDEILHEEVFIGPVEADEHENLMKEHQVEENRNPNETVAMSPGNRAICEEADSNAVCKEHLEASYSTEKAKRGNLDVEAMSNSNCDAQIQEVLHQGKTQEEENCGSVAETEHANKDGEKLKDLDNWYDKVDTAPKTSLTSTPSSCMAPEEEKPVDDSGTGFDKELPKEVEIETGLLKEKFETQLQDKHLATEDENVGRENVTAESLKADGLGRITIASEPALGSKDPGTDVIDAVEETTAEELDVSERRSHCLKLLHEADATSDQDTSAKALEVQIQTRVSALLQEEHKEERKRDIQNVQETETLLFSSAAEAKEEIWQKENGQFDPPKVHPRGSETIQDNLTEKYNECCCTQDEGLEPETQSQTKCTDFSSDSGKLVDLTSATESHVQGVCHDLVKSASQVKIQEDFNEPEDTGTEENQVHALARDLRAGEKAEETSKANETSQGEDAKGQIVEQLEDIDSRPINEEITEGSCEEDELHREKFVEGKTHNTFPSKANELRYQEDETKHSAVDKDNAPEEFDKVHVERETADKKSIDEAEGNITSEGATESEDQNSKTNSGSGKTDAMICNEESSVEKTRKGDDLGLEEAKETDPVLEQMEDTSIAVPEMPVSGEACLSTAPDVIVTEGNEDRSPTLKESIVETIQNSEAKNVELADPSKADLEPKGIEYGGQTTCTSDEKASGEDMPKDTSLVSLSDLLDKIPEGNSPTTEPWSKERRPTDEPDAVPPEQLKIDEERDEHEEDEHERTELGHDAPVMVEPCKDIVVKAPHKKSHNILSGVSSKVKHSISKVKKAITGKSSHSKAHSPK